MIYALIEGLAGIKDLGHSYEKVRISPRWAASDEKRASVQASYGPSGRSVSYNYLYDEARGTVTLVLGPGGPSEVEWRVLLPKGKGIRTVTCNGKTADFELEQIEESCYVALDLTRTRTGQKVNIRLKENKK